MKFHRKPIFKKIMDSREKIIERESRGVVEKLYQKAFFIKPISKNKPMLLRKIAYPCPLLFHLTVTC